MEQAFRVNQKKLLSHNKIVPFYVERKSLPEDQLQPIAVELHWTSNCNYDCVHCSYGSRRMSKGRLDSQEIQLVIDDLIDMRVQAVYLSGGGEPTLVKDWDRYAGQLLDRGVDVSLITNGVAIKESNLSVMSRMNYVAVSIYSDDESQYTATTESRFFDKQWSVPSLIKREGGRVIVGARCVINKINYRNTLNIYLRAKEAGYDYVIFIPAVDYEGRGVDLGAVAEEAESIIEQNWDKFDSSFTNVLDVLGRNFRHYDKGSYLKEFRAGVSGCAAIGIRANAFVNYCGGVWLCQPHIGSPEFQIGNVKENKISEIWNSDRHKAVIEKLHSNFRMGLCRNCRSIKFNKAVDDFESAPYDLQKAIRDPFV